VQSLVAKGSEYWVFYAEWLGQPKAEDGEYGVKNCWAAVDRGE
jgi:hypothetical protein